jgi:hypothetical protein
MSYSRVTYSRNALYGLVSPVVVVLVNLVYAYTIQVFYNKSKRGYEVDGANARPTQ